jgi:hypothetical protein
MHTSCCGISDLDLSALPFQANIGSRSKSLHAAQLMHNAALERWKIANHGRLVLCRLPEREREKEKGSAPRKDLLLETRERREAQEREAARAARERREAERAQPRQAPAPREAARRPDDRHVLPERCAHA